MKTINWKTVGMIFGCILTGVTAFTGELDKKNQEKTIKELVEKVAKLEGKES